MPREEIRMSGLSGKVAIVSGASRNGADAPIRDVLVRRVVSGGMKKAL